MICRMRHAIRPNIMRERVENLTLIMKRVTSAKPSATMRATAKANKRNRSYDASPDQSSTHRDKSNKRGKNTIAIRKLEQ